jgi:hypothetical protein
MQKNRSAAHKIALLLLGGMILVGCTFIKPTAVPNASVYGASVSRDAFVFEDANANGQYDSGEKPLPDVLVTSHSNIHGADKRLLAWTGEDGYATFDVTYTHTFDIHIVPLCGYEPTTPIHWDARQPEQIMVGLAPIQPRDGDALVRFFLWFDEDRDGEQDEYEPPLDYTDLQITLSEGDFVAEKVEWDALSLTTGEDGWGEINLGNTCGRLNLSVLQFEPWTFGFWEITDAQPEPVFFDPYGSSESIFRYAEFPYNLGETVIKMGLAPMSSDDVPRPVLNIARRNVMVFEDTNANGSYDPDEKPLSNVPIYHWTWLSTFGERKLVYTNDTGQAIVEALHIEELLIKAASPCGYTPTTPLMLTVDQPSDNTLYFGFEPEAPVDGEAVIRVHLWRDQNHNGEQEQNDLPLIGEVLYVYPFDDSGYGYPIQEIERDNVAAITDKNGWAEFHLGNTCGTLEINPSYITGWPRQGTIKHYDPEPVGLQSPDDMPNSPRIQFDYDIGVTVIEIGLTD